MTIFFFFFKKGGNRKKKEKMRTKREVIPIPPPFDYPYPPWMATHPPPHMWLGELLGILHIIYLKKSSMGHVCFICCTTSCTFYSLHSALVAGLGAWKRWLLHGGRMIRWCGEVVRWWKFREMIEEMRRITPCFIE